MFIVGSSQLTTLWLLSTLFSSGEQSWRDYLWVTRTTRAWRAISAWSAVGYRQWLKVSVLLFYISKMV